MRKNVFIALIAAVALLGATAASALTVNVTLNTTSTSIANGYVDNGDGTITADLTAGDFIVLNVWAANPDADRVSGVFTSLAHDSTQSSFAGGNQNPIFENPSCTGFGCSPATLNPSVPVASKPNDPNSNGTGTEDWIQVIGHTSTFDDGTGNGIGVVGTGDPGLGDLVSSLAFQVTGAGGFEEVAYILGKLTGDAVSSGVTSESYGGLVFNPIPEPGTALLMGLGLMGLGAAGRRK